MAVGKGFLNIMGFKKETVFGTPVACGALNGVEYNTESMTSTSALIADAQINGQPTQLTADAGIISHGGDINLDARYEGIETIMAMGYGTAGVPSQSSINRQTADGAGNTGAPTKITSATAAFVAGDVGKRITLAGAGVASALLDTTITARDSATQVTIAGAVATNQAAGALIIYDIAYTHVLKINSTLEGIFGTLAQWVQGINVHEYVSVKVNTVSFEVKKGDRTKITLNVVAQKLNENVGSGTNTTTTAATITYPTNRAFLNFQQMTVRINDQSAGALSSSDNVYVNEIKWKLDNKLATDDVTTQFGNLIDEPIRDGFVSLTGSVGFSKYQSNNNGLFTQQLSKARKKMSIVFNSGTLVDPAGITNFQWNMWFPDIQFADGTPNTGGPGRMAYSLNFVAHRVTAVPTGFTAGYTDVMTLEMVNARTTDALA